ncbi:aminoglycoside phosphotransferase family protein [Marinobacterium aestuariivivens]|uniref:Aminoglycoside phosphotransferase family protein n=1 Tax=Marinobacterium aestuariivivens TaxID=1698799 RepID=A0ABW1ZWV6_9GAMM
MDQRLADLQTWVERAFEQLGIDLAADWRLTPVSGDASFRRYYRVHSHNMTWIAVDAPPEHEDSRQFVAIARAWAPLDIHVPRIHACDLDHGFMLQSDLGDTLYLDVLNEQNADELYGKALVSLSHIQQCRALGRSVELPLYDRGMLSREMEIFRDWFIGQLLGLVLSDAEQELLDHLFEELADSALAQPQVCVHRDFHSRNLMVSRERTPGVIDFQGAVIGPITYDLVSLLRDCYISWPEERVYDWMARFGQTLVKAEMVEGYNEAMFRSWFDLMGMQRHLKAVGIFARLDMRDGKAAYLADIPRTLGYILRVAEQYPEFDRLVAWLQKRVVPAMKASGYFDRAELQRWLVR